MKNILTILFAVVAVVSLSACEPKRGSDAWCKKMDGIPKGEWSFNDAGDYTKYCVLKQKPEEN